MKVAPGKAAPGRRRPGFTLAGRDGRAAPSPPPSAASGGGTVPRRKPSSREAALPHRPLFPGKHPNIFAFFAFFRG